MLKAVICIVVEVLLAVFFAAYVPRTFFKTVKRLETGATDEKNKKTRDAYRRCQDELNPLCINVTLGAGLCVAFLFLNGIEKSGWFTFLFCAYLLCAWLLHFKLRKFVEPAIEKYMRESGKIDELDRWKDGLLGEGWISICFLVPYFALIYQVLALLFG
ncbi:MAG: hypothetical protein IIX01_04570 [Clostridia bacterium]|nr:hypothetical protein [Clostridia bacterium]